MGRIWREFWVVLKQYPWPPNGKFILLAEQFVVRVKRATHSGVLSFAWVTRRKSDNCPRGIRKALGLIGVHLCPVLQVIRTFPNAQYHSGNRD